MCQHSQVKGIIRSKFWVRYVKLCTVCGKITVYDRVRRMAG